MSYFLSPVGTASQISGSGAPLVSGTIETYAAGTTTPATTYTDNMGGGPQAQPIVLNVYGLPDSPIWFAQGQAYKFVIKDADGNLIRTLDNLSGIGDTTATLGAPTGSSLVGYRPAGTGAVDTDEQTKLRQIVSVFDFLTTAQKADVTAKTYGLDVAARVATAVTVAAAAGAILWGNPGGYRMDSQAAVAANNITIEGAGPGSTIFASNSATANVFNFGDGVTEYTNVFVSGVGFTALVTPKTAGDYVKFNKITRCGIENFKADLGFRAFDLDTTILSHVRDGYITNATATTGMGVRIRGGNDQELSNFVVTGNSGGQSKCGVLVESTGGLWLDNVGAIFSGIGLLMQPTTSGDIIQNVFSQRCAWDSGSSHGWMLDAPAGTTIRRIKSVEDWCATNDGNGFVTNGLGTVTDIEFIAPRFLNNALHGASFPSGSEVRIVGGTAAGNSRTSSGTYNGLNFDNNFSAFSVIGMRAGPVGGFANTQRYGIFLNGAPTNFIIALCDCRGNATGAMNFSVPLTATEIVKLNVGFVTENGGLTSGTTDGSGDLTVTHGCSMPPTRVFPAMNNLSAVATVQAHSITGTTFKLRFFNIAAAGAPMTGFAMGDVAWDAVV